MVGLLSVRWLFIVLLLVDWNR